MHEKPNIWKPYTDKNYTYKLCMGFWPGPQQIKPKIWENLKSKTINWDSTASDIQTALP
jgi:hypothetical protein